MKKKKSSPLFRPIRQVVKWCYPKITVHGVEHLEGGATIVVGNHAQVHGPLSCELYFPVSHATWCAGEMMELKEVPRYAFRDFWSQKPWYSRWLYKIASYLIAPLAVFVFRNADTIAVYHDMRSASTFKTTVNALKEGITPVIFPEHDEPHNAVVCDFQEKFVDVARLYHKKTGESIQFVPMYVAPRLKSMYFGAPIRFRAEAPIEEERRRICDYLMKEISAIAYGLPLHTVVPYRNIPKRLYPKNREDSHETTGG